MANDGWVLTAFSRYCPDCVSGTAHLPDDRIWQGSRRLPHTFLCERHNRLLDLAMSCLPRAGILQRLPLPQPPTHRGWLGPRTIPAVLPEHWAAPLDDLGAPIRQLCRDAAIRLVQMATDRSRRSAALCLGIPLGSLQSSTLTIRAWQKHPGNAEAYQRALQRVAEIAMREGQRDQCGDPAE
ncbi:hypothetical protein AB0890_02345 [Streptomyces sp. NPDC005406]|uniref:hypothetical protein n=1 Tax=Streptomyces sp. NPDC005406 TaxID=3155339 RepID=UPI0034567096